MFVFVVVFKCFSLVAVFGVFCLHMFSLLYVVLLRLSFFFRVDISSPR
jgi:hypothetical protein